jgi:choline dehydrogenase-like flavoprotein
MILCGQDITGPVRESADVCIIGSGCGGGASARVLAQAGKKVIVLEEERHYTSKDFDSTEETAYQRLYQQRAGQATDDLSVTVLQGLSQKELEPYFERVERYLNVHVEPEQNYSPNNRIILDGANKLGYHAAAVGRNTEDCIKAGACGLGCPYDAKMSVGVTYLPDALKAGATLFADSRANRIEGQGKAKRVMGAVLDRETRAPKTDFIIEAPVVIVSASAINSPVLLLKSELANSSRQVGKNLTFHLTSAVLGIYDSVIYGAGGIPQSAMCDEFLNKNGDGGGFWIEAVPIYPTLASLALPGFGSFHWEMMKQYRTSAHRSSL